MGEVLSQNEIDSLLDALNTGVLDADEVKNEKKQEKSIKEYNFARPSKFSKDQLRTLEMIFESYVRLLSTNLTLILRNHVEAEIINTEPIAYQEFINSMPNPAILGIVELAPLKGAIILELSNNVGYAMIERLLGGDGLTNYKAKEFSDIEVAILERIFESCASMMSEPWENVIHLTPAMDRIETNPQYAQIASSNEMMALLTLSIKVNNMEGLMNICIPYMVIEPVMHKLNTKFWFANMQKSISESYEEVIEKRIEGAGLECSGVLGKTTLNLFEVLNLQVGDVIKLEETVEDKIEVLIDRNLKFYGRPGTHNGKNAIKIIEAASEEE